MMAFCSGPNVQGPSYLCLIRSISWLLMSWLFASPGHQQPWYWLSRIGRSLSYLRKDFNYLCHINGEELHKMSIYVMFPLKNLAGNKKRFLPHHHDHDWSAAHASGCLQTRFCSSQQWLPLPPLHLSCAEWNKTYHKTRKNIYRSNVQVTSQLYCYFRCLQVLCSI